MLEKRHVPKEKITKSARYMLGISAISMLGLWYLIYAFSPTKRLVAVLPISFLKNGYSALEKRASNMKYPKNLNPQERGRLAISILELIPSNIALAPILLPLKVWLSVKLS
ncbi:unnamed protein product [Blepharisma stoltei]|uniref:Uncharacterized protein n=1 Tax=Blepharisma stoltei TaxID=1481888 RepID=A0AAU9J7S6_9CILI|nr:unnamed protein product [Blepharisma stoltei]